MRPLPLLAVDDGAGTAAATSAKAIGVSARRVATQAGLANMDGAAPIPPPWEYTTLVSGGTAHVGGAAAAIVVAVAAVDRNGHANHRRTAAIIDATAPITHPNPPPPFRHILRRG